MYQFLKCNVWPHSILDLDPEKSLQSQQKPEEGDDDGLPLKQDPKYVKYYKMMKMGLPKEAVKHAMARDQVDPRCVSRFTRCHSTDRASSFSAIFVM